jgi:hypothetical protein
LVWSRYPLDVFFGPWHFTQWASKIGLICLTKSTFAPGGAGAGVGAFAATGSAKAMTGVSKSGSSTASSAAGCVAG